MTFDGQIPIIFDRRNKTHLTITGPFSPLRRVFVCVNAFPVQESTNEGDYDHAR